MSNSTLFRLFRLENLGLVLMKMKKQMSYANAKQVRFVALAGESEIAEGKITLKDMVTGEQELVSKDALVDTVCGKL